LEYATSAQRTSASQNSRKVSLRTVLSGSTAAMDDRKMSPISSVDRMTLDERSKSLANLRNSW
jgi:hypothetical protein